MNRSAQGRLREYLERTLDSPIRELALDRIAVGQSRAMYRADLVFATGETRALVVRIEQWGLLGTTSEHEVAIMRRLHALGYPVAPIHCYETDPAILGQPFFIMEFIEGSATPDAASLDAYVRKLHELHERWQIAEFPFLPQPAPGNGSALLQVERWYEAYRKPGFEAMPLLEDGAEWLRQNAPPTARPCLVHGDPGPGNYLQRDGEVALMADWEFAHLGDPLEDWAYLICMRGARSMSETSWLATIERLTSLCISPKELRYWKALNFFKGACLDVTAMRGYKDGVNPAPNLLAIATGVQLSALKQLCAIVYR